MAKLFKFNLKSLRAFWIMPPDDSEQSFKTQICKDIMYMSSSIFILFGVLSDLYFQLVVGPVESLSVVIDGFVISSGMFLLLFFVIFIMIKRRNILHLISSIENLCKISCPPDLEDNEKKLELLTKGFIAYGNIGAIIYISLPLAFINHCIQEEMQSNHTHPVPCGFVTRIWYPFNYTSFPGFHMLIVVMIVAASAFANFIMGAFAVQGGVIIHAMGHIKHLKKEIQKAFLEENLHDDFNDAIIYHIEIVKCCEEMNKCFSNVSFIHSFFASIILSALCFQIKTISSIYDMIRFILHLFAWVMVIFYRNFVSQLLIDDSLDVGDTLYNADWPGKDLSVQKKIALVLMRSQKQLAVARGGYGILSLEEFYATMGTTYTYFTLLASYQ